MTRNQAGFTRRPSMLFSLAVERCSSYTDNDKNTKGVAVRLYVCGALIELYLTARNPFK